MILLGHKTSLCKLIHGLINLSFESISLLQVFCKNGHLRAAVRVHFHPFLSAQAGHDYYAVNQNPPQQIHGDLPCKRSSTSASYAHLSDALHAQKLHQILEYVWFVALHNVECSHPIHVNLAHAQTHILNESCIKNLPLDCFRIYTLHSCTFKAYV